MFKCDKCKRIVGPCITEHKRVTETQLVGIMVQIAHEEKLCPFCAIENDEDSTNVHKFFMSDGNAVMLRSLMNEHHSG